MDKIEQKIMDLIERHKDEIIAIGRDIWNEPELGYKEYQTAGKFCRHLKTLESRRKPGWQSRGPKAI